MRGARIGVLADLDTFSLDVRRLVADCLETMREAGAEIVDAVHITAADAIRPSEITVMKTEYKVGLDAYLAGAGPGAPVHGMAELIAFNEANAGRTMPRTASRPCARPAPRSSIRFTSPRPTPSGLRDNGDEDRVQGGAGRLSRRRQPGHQSGCAALPISSPSTRRTGTGRCRTFLRTCSRLRAHLEMGPGRPGLSGGPAHLPEADPGRGHRPGAAADYTLDAIVGPTTSAPWLIDWVNGDEKPLRQHRLSGRRLRLCRHHRARRLPARPAGRPLLHRRRLLGTDADRPRGHAFERATRVRRPPEFARTVSF